MTTSHKKLVFIVNNPGFFLSHRINLAEAAGKLGYRVRLLSPTPSDQELEVLKTYHVAWDKMPLRPADMNILGIFSSFFQAMLLAGSRGGSVFYLITIIPTLLYGLPLRIFNRPLMVPIPGLGSFFYSSRFTARILQRLIALIYRFILNGRNSVAIVQNQDHRRTLLSWGVRRDKIQYIPGSGVDESKFYYSPRKNRGFPPAIVVPARLLADKGIREACQASGLLDQWQVPHKMIFAGSSDPGNPSSLSRNEISHLAKEFPSVQFPGFVREMHSLLLESDLVCLPSYHEGLPRALIEAFAIGRPVVTTDVTGCREIVKHGLTGLLAQVKDPRSVALNIRKIIEDPELAGKLSRNAHTFFLKHLTLRKVTAQTMNLLKNSEATNRKVSAPGEEENREKVNKAK